MNIIDSHCHAWPRWPYQPPVPDDEYRGRIEQLVHEMDVNGVAAAVIICAQIERNPENNAYVMEQAAHFPALLSFCRRGQLLVAHPSPARGSRTSQPGRRAVADKRVHPLSLRR